MTNFRPLPFEQRLFRQSFRKRLFRIFATSFFSRVVKHKKGCTYILRIYKNDFTLPPKKLIMLYSN